MGWGLMKIVEGRNEEVINKFGDKRTQEERDAYNETELMFKIIRGGGEANLRCVQFLKYEMYLLPSSLFNKNAQWSTFYECCGANVIFFGSGSIFVSYFGFSSCHILPLKTVL